MLEAPMPTILVVDDDDDTRCNIADLFGDVGYHVDAAEGAAKALQHARQKPYDVGVLDLRMPGMDGLTLCRRLKQMRPGIVTLIVTGHPGDGLDEEARDAGARHVLRKPVDFGALLALVERSLAPPIEDCRWLEVATGLRPGANGLTNLEPMASNCIGLPASRSLEPSG